MYGIQDIKTGEYIEFIDMDEEEALAWFNQYDPEEYNLIDMAAPEGQDVIA